MVNTLLTTPDWAMLERKSGYKLNAALAL